MVNDNLVSRIEKAFENPKGVEADQYQRIIEANAAKVAQNAEKSTFLLLSLIIFFILIIQGAINKIDLEFTEIGDLRLIVFIIPVIVSYSHYDLVTSLAKFDRLSTIYKNIIKQRHKSIYEQKLTEYFLFTPTLWEYKYLSTNQVAQLIQLLIWAIILISITIVIPLSFQIYAFWQLLTEYSDVIISYDIGRIALLISLFIVVILSLQSVLIIVFLMADSLSQLSIKTRR